MFVRDFAIARFGTDPMPAIFEFPLRVTSADLDGVIEHVNNLVYLKWMQSAAVAHSAAQGWPAERYRELGAGWVVRSHHIEYLQAAFDDDEIIVRTWVANLKKVTSLRRFQIVRTSGEQETLLANAATDWAFIHFATHQPKRIPPEVASAFEIVADIA
jgi:acyl-CoA thioester hydrolase